jgi:hypothetical protein
LIAYFIDRHLFLPRERLLDVALMNLIDEAEDSLAGRINHDPDCKKMHGLEEKKKALSHKLFEADDLLLRTHMTRKRSRD